VEPGGKCDAIGALPICVVVYGDVGQALEAEFQELVVGSSGWV